MSNNAQYCLGEQGKGTADDVPPLPADLTSPAVQKKLDAELTHTLHGGERGTTWEAWKSVLPEKRNHNALLSGRLLAR